MQPEIVDVDANMNDADGHDYSFLATPEMVADGTMVNVPVILRFPDGKLFHGQKAMFTQEGLERLKRELPIELRDMAGSA